MLIDANVLTTTLRRHQSSVCVICAISESVRLAIIDQDI